MYGMSYGSMSQEHPQKYHNIPSEHFNTNRFVYIKQHIDEKYRPSCLNGSQKVLINPRFKMNKVFVNPKFSKVQPNTIHVNPRVKNLDIAILGNKQSVDDKLYQTNLPLQSTKIHINPNAISVQIPLHVSQVSKQVVHINPNFKSGNILNKGILNNTTLQMSHAEEKESETPRLINEAIVLTKTKLIRAPVINKNKKLKRRNSVKSNYKIVKSSLASSNKNILENNTEVNKSRNRYKIDRRRRKSLSIIAKNQKKYVYVNRFLSITDLVKDQVIKSSSVSPVKNTTIVNISGVIYKKSKTSLRRTSITSLIMKKSPNRTVQLSKYKLVKKPTLKKLTVSKINPETINRPYENHLSKKLKIVRRTSPKKSKTTVSPKKLRKCNIPCPYYKKYGSCKGKDNGKCFRKHDPDQIALCTRFLQGACIKEHCLLSHNVSPEKMPTCKYYLEGSCSRENCPYLHVKISSKAEVCRDFLEGFCKKAAECDKRHQYLCPDYEKYGTCMKQRCPYPHGKMVRNYFSNKTKFAKKCSDIDKKTDQNKSVETNVGKNQQLQEKQRYYDEKKSKREDVIRELNTTVKSTLERTKNNDEVDKSTTKNFIGLQSRPKLGILPSFIPFNK